MMKKSRLHDTLASIVTPRLAALVVLASSVNAYAAGLYLVPRGVRPMSRGGSFIAGADDINALTYNPAGLSDAKPAVFIDLSLPVHSTTYARRISANGTTMPGVTGSDMGLPIPTLGVTFSPSQRLHMGAGLSADVPLLQNWSDAENSPQRYAIQNYDGTALLKFVAGASYDVLPALSLGMTVQMLTGSFAAQTTISNCDGFLCTRPERTEYDAVVRMVATGITTFGLQFGANFKPVPWLRVGLAYETGYSLDEEAELQVRLPSASAYSDAALTPNKPTGQIKMKLPGQARAGVEVRLDDTARLEASVVWENWSVHDKISITPNNVTIQGLPAPLNDYAMASMDIDRRFRDTWSMRLGGQWIPPFLSLNRALALRAGVMYEPSAIPDATLTAMNVDLDKVMAAAGASYTLFERLIIDVTYAHVFMFDRQVNSSEVLQTNPTRPALRDRTAIGNGDYSAHADVFGLGARWLL